MKQEDQIVVRCSQTLKSRLRQYAADQSVDLSSVVRRACEAFVVRSMTTSNNTEICRTFGDAVGHLVQGRK